MIEFADLLGARPPVFAALADRWDALASTVSGQHEQWQTDIVGGLATGSWCGAASDTAGQYVSGLDGRLADHATTLRRVSATVRQSAPRPPHRRLICGP